MDKAVQVKGFGLERTWAELSSVAVGGRSLGAVRCGAQFTRHKTAGMSEPIPPHPALPSIHDAYRFFLCSRRGAVSPETIVHIPVTLEPWNAKIWFSVSLALLHLTFTRSIGRPDFRVSASESSAEEHAGGNSSSPALICFKRRNSTSWSGSTCFCSRSRRGHAEPGKQTQVTRSDLP